MNVTDKKIILFPIPISELRKIIEETVKNEILKAIPPPPKDHTLITRSEACEILRISLVTLDRFIKSGIVPAYRMNSKVRLKKDEVIGCI